MSPGSTAGFARFRIGRGRLGEETLEDQGAVGATREREGQADLEEPPIQIIWLRLADGELFGNEHRGPRLFLEEESRDVLDVEVPKVEALVIQGMPQGTRDARITRSRVCVGQGQLELSQLESSLPSQVVRKDQPTAFVLRAQPPFRSRLGLRGFDLWRLRGCLLRTGRTLVGCVVLERGTGEERLLRTFVLHGLRCFDGGCLGDFGSGFALGLEVTAKHLVPQEALISTQMNELGAEWHELERPAKVARMVSEVAEEPAVE